MFIPLAGGLGNLRDVENLQVSNFGSHGELLQTIQNVLVLLCMVQNLMRRLRRHFKAFKSFATNRGPFERPFLAPHNIGRPRYYEETRLARQQALSSALCMSRRVRRRAT
jgi:hypothetical protein